jgi:hypothetical protein
MGRIVVGTSSWADPGFLEEWYPPGLPALDRLSWYAGHFDGVDVNSTFYAVPAVGQVRRWVDETPAGFTFDVKLHRLLSRHSAPADSLPPALRVGVRTTPRGRVRLDDRLEAALADAVLAAVAPLAHASGSRPSSCSSRPPSARATTSSTSRRRSSAGSHRTTTTSRSCLPSMPSRTRGWHTCARRPQPGGLRPRPRCRRPLRVALRRRGARGDRRAGARLTAARGGATLPVNVRSSRESQLSPARRRVLVVANRTAATPDLLAAVTRHAREQPTSFTLLIPDAPRGEHADWTLELALPLLERAAGGRVQGMTGTAGDPFDAVRHVLREGRYELVLVSTLPRRVSAWLRRDLPKRIEALGVPVEVVTARGRRPIQELFDDAARSGLPPAGLG